MARKSKHIDKRFELTVKLNNGTLSTLQTESYPFALQVSRLLKNLPCVDSIQLFAYQKVLPYRVLFDESSFNLDGEFPF